MGKGMRFKAGTLVGVALLLLGCATTKETQMLDERISVLQVQLNGAQTEKNMLKDEFAAFRGKAQDDISFLKKEVASYQKEARTTISTLQEGQDLLNVDLTAELKSLRTDFLLRLQTLQTQVNRVQAEKDSLKSDFAAFLTDTRKNQSDLSLRLQALQTQVNRVQADKDSLRNDFAAFQKEAQVDLIALKEGDKRLSADLSAETQRTRADLFLRLETLNSDLRTLSAGIEDYRAFLKKPLAEMDRLREDVAQQMKGMEEKGKTVEARNKVHEDRTRVLEERSKIQDDRTRALEARDKSQEDRARSLEERGRFYDDRARALEERMRWVEDRYKDVDGKIGSLASKQGELEKSIALRVPSVAPQELYDDAHQAFQKGDFEKALSQFEVFLKAYPNVELSDNAQFMIGEVQYQKKDFEKAILEYERVIAKYPRADAVPGALYKQALAFSELGDRTNARSLLKRLIDQYPGFDQIAAAKKKLESIQ